MANLSQIQVGGTTYDICDTTARDSIVQINDSISQINEVYSTTVTLSNVTFSTAPIVYLKRWRYLVHASTTDVVNAATANSQITVGTIPTGYRPYHSVEQSGAAVSNNSFSGYYKWILLSGGNINYLASVTGAREAPFIMTYYCNKDYPSD